MRPIDKEIYILDGKYKVAPLVRCKDCMHYQEKTESTGVCGLFMKIDVIVAIAESDYCSMAERKEE